MNPAVRRILRQQRMNAKPYGSAAVSGEGHRRKEKKRRSTRMSAAPMPQQNLEDSREFIEFSKKDAKKLGKYRRTSAPNDNCRGCKHGLSTNYCRVWDFTHDGRRYTCDEFKTKGSSSEY
jgi:hypothetical protein